MQLAEQVCLGQSLSSFMRVSRAEKFDFGLLRSRLHRFSPRVLAGVPKSCVCAEDHEGRSYRLDKPLLPGWCCEEAAEIQQLVAFCIVALILFLPIGRLCSVLRVYKRCCSASTIPPLPVNLGSKNKKHLSITYFEMTGAGNICATR